MTADPQGLSEENRALVERLDIAIRPAGVFMFTPAALNRLLDAARSEGLQPSAKGEVKNMGGEPSSDASVSASPAADGPRFERVAGMLEAREFIACWNGGNGHDLAGSQGFDNASDFIAWIIRQAYHEGWSDREDDLICGVNRIAPSAAGQSLTGQAQDGASHINDQAHPAEQGKDGWVLVPQSALDWLYGSHKDGFERPDGAKGNFWWRLEFRRRIEAAAPPLVEGEE